MDVNTKIHAATFNLLDYIEKEEYKGYDPYDALKSPLFNLPLLRTNKLIRFGAQQFGKRFPINLRPFLMIPKGLNPVTLGLCIQAYKNLAETSPEHLIRYEHRINKLIKNLIELIPDGYKGACWGYDFDWEARYTNIPSYQPNIVSTGIITNALFNAHLVLKIPEALDLCVSSIQFILHDIKRTYEGDGFCFSYSPFDKQIVFNASMKGARGLAQVYSITKDESLKEQAKKAVDFVMKHQDENWAWKYSQNKVGDWIDNYHTGYVIDCLDDYIRYSGDSTYRDNLDKSFNYYKEHFFQDDRIPKFYNKNVYPIDCTAAGQSLLTLIRFNQLDLAQNVASWMIDNMQAKEGFFYFRKFKSRTIKTSFMRWSNAWMLLGLTELLSALSVSYVKI